MPEFLGYLVPSAMSLNYILPSNHDIKLIPGKCE